MEFYSTRGSLIHSGSPFEPAQGEPCHLEESLKEIKEVWLRLLVYVAGRCRAELHKRQHRKFDFFYLKFDYYSSYLKFMQNITSFIVPCFINTGSSRVIYI